MQKAEILWFRRAPACTIETLAKATKELFDKGNKCEIKVIDIPHGEKMYETLLTMRNALMLQIWVIFTQFLLIKEI